MEESEEWEEYKCDKRQACRYGEGCYRKNPAHLKEFKHPPKAEKEHEELPEAKRRKVDDDEPKEEESVDTEESLAGTDSSDKDESESDEKEEEEELPPSPKDMKESIRQKFLVEMPDDFFSFWDFCKTQKKDKPEDALLKAAGLQLVGAFDALSGKLKDVKPRLRSKYLRHWRYYYDPPEFQTVIKGDDSSQLHFGYFRDEPKELPVFVGMNKASEGCKIVIQGENLFAAISLYLQSRIKEADTFAKVPLQRLLQNLEKWSKEKDYSLEVRTPEMKARTKKVATAGFHSCGIVVPVDKKTEVGYRELMMNYASLKRLLNHISDPETSEDRRKQRWDDLEEVVTAVHIANDEGDFGTGLELGLALLAFGGEEFHKHIKSVLSVAYTLLQRSEFYQILEAHLADRRKGASLSVVD